jgi:excisionase family DNA binding protein
MTENRTAVSLAEPLLTADEVAALLRIPRTSVYEYARRQHNPLPSITVGRHRRFHRGDVERWLGARASERAATATPEA